MKNMSRFIVFVLMLFPTVLHAEDIGFGFIQGIKIGHSNQEAAYIYLEPGYTNDSIGCNGELKLRYAILSKTRLDQIFAAALSAQLARKKIRFHSHNSNCDITFAVMQDVNF